MSTNPLGSVQSAWDSLITKRSSGAKHPETGELYFTKDHQFTAQNFIDEIEELNGAMSKKFQREIDLRSMGWRENKPT